MHIKLLIVSTLICFIFLITYTEAYRPHKRNRSNRNQTRSHMDRSHGNSTIGRKSQFNNTNPSESRTRLRNTGGIGRNSSVSGHNTTIHTTFRANNHSHESNSYSKELTFNSNAVDAQYNSEVSPTHQPVYIVYNQPQNTQFSLKENFTEGFSEGLNISKRINEVLESLITRKEENENSAVSSKPLETINVVAINTIKTVTEEIPTQKPEQLINGETVSSSTEVPSPSVTVHTVDLVNSETLRPGDLCNSEVVSSSPEESKNDLTVNCDVMSPSTLNVTSLSEETLPNFHVIVIYIV